MTTTPDTPTNDGSAPNRRERLLAGIDVARKRGLEMAPLARPIVLKSEGDVTYVDRNDTATLIERHRNDPALCGRAVVPIDVAVGERLLPDALSHLAKFDYIVASHVVEHIPNLVTWFEEFRAILNPGGSVRLAVPDKRFTFDHLRSETTITEVLDAYVRNTRHPTSHSVIDQLLFSRPVDLVKAWDGELGNVRALPAIFKPRDVLAMARRAAATNEYFEVHCWAFTPRSFALLFAELGRLGLMKFACTGYFDTARYSLEFIVHMTPSNDRRQVVKSWNRMARNCTAGPKRSLLGRLRAGLR